MSKVYYTTKNELDFLAHLGTGAYNQAKKIRRRRRSMLKKYRRAARRRTDWGRIDPTAVMDYLSLQLDA